jgi:hypothetical protein
MSTKHVEGFFYVTMENFNMIWKFKIILKKELIAVSNLLLHIDLKLKKS